MLCKLSPHHQYNIELYKMVRQAIVVTWSYRMREHKLCRVTDTHLLVLGKGILVNLVQNGKRVGEELGRC